MIACFKTPETESFQARERIVDFMESNRPWSTGCMIRHVVGGVYCQPLSISTSSIGSIMECSRVLAILKRGGRRLAMEMILAQSTHRERYDTVSHSTSGNPALLPTHASFHTVSARDTLYNCVYLHSIPIAYDNSAYRVLACRKYVRSRPKVRVLSSRCLTF